MHTYCSYFYYPIYNNDHLFELDKFKFKILLYVVLFNDPIIKKIIRYSAISTGEDEENIVVLSGTVFQEIVVWSPFRKSNGSNILHRLKKHEVRSTNYSSIVVK